MSKPQERNSSIELLKIISMILIVAHHYSGHGGYETFSVDDFSFNIAWIQMLSLFGKIACSIFAMSTGFFMIDRVRENHYRKIVPMIFQMTLYSWTILLIYVSILKEPIGIYEIIKSFFPIAWGNWYVVNYILLYLFIPIINLMLENIKRKSYTLLIAISMIVWCIVPTFTINAWSFSSLDFFLVMYLLGGYIRRYIYGKMIYKNSYNVLFASVCTILLILSVIVFDILALFFNNNIILQHATYFKSYNSILSVPCAIFIFLYFANLQISSKSINYIAGSTLGIYLIHDNSLLNEIIWEKIWPNVNYIDNPYIHSLIKIAFVFIVCLVMDVFYRETIGRWFSKWFSKNCDRWGRKIKKNILISKVIQYMED